MASLPTDIVAVDNGDKSYMFYVSKNGNKLSCLKSPDSSGAGDFTSQVIQLPDDKDKSKKKDVTVSGSAQQVAAIVWDNHQAKVTHIRVYYVDSDNNLSEVCQESDNPDVWFQGSLGHPDKHKWPIATNAPISATVHKREAKRDLRVFAAGKDQKNSFGNPTISVFKFTYDELSKNNLGDWFPSPISNKIQAW